MLFESTSPEMDEQLLKVTFDNQSVLGQITAPTSDGSAAMMDSISAGETLMPARLMMSESRATK